ncbi:LysR family transcriptional regulator [Sinorhizobium medicae]|uniref:LysR family transcriptional regulator n=1 Tax=Sinorhizobium medicae TaxID=110321 RepID=UPI0030869181|nr:LysR family transcriptional regulator [Sinorhizobium medicae]
MVNPLDSDLLRTFLAVADTGNVTRAADIVRRTQSAVSMQILQARGAHRLRAVRTPFARRDTDGRGPASGRQRTPYRNPSRRHGGSDALTGA